MRALLAASFGTSFEDTRVKTIDVIAERLREEFSDCAFYTAWTSTFIVKKVRKRGEHHDTLDEAFARMTADGVDEVVVATTCLMDGNEMGKIKAAARAWADAAQGRVAHVADPLLYTAGDRRAMAQAICDEFAFVAQDEALLLMGHGLEGVSDDIAGTPADPNFVYRQIQEDLVALGRPRFIVSTVEGDPEFADALEALGDEQSGRVYLAPFMYVAGDHAKNDLAGDEDDSWANVLRGRGWQVEAVLKGLGEYPAIQKLVCEHAHAALGA